jgi:hypothetical protein
MILPVTKNRIRKTEIYIIARWTLSLPANTPWHCPQGQLVRRTPHRSDVLSRVRSEISKKSFCLLLEDCSPALACDASVAARNDKLK